MAPILGYWEPRGVGQQIKLMLAYLGIPYEFRNYSSPDVSKPSWYKQKFDTGSIELTELPYWSDNDVKIAQSGNIMRYLARRYDLGPTSEAEKIRMDILETTLQDLRNNHMQLCYLSLDFPADKAAYCSKFRREIARDWSDYLGQKPYLMGDRITYVDFILYELLSVHEMFDSQCLNGYANLVDYMNRIESFKGINRFLRSDTWDRHHVYSPAAIWNGGA